MNRNQAHVSFTVPAGSGSYAAEVLYLTSDANTTRPKTQGGFDPVRWLRGAVLTLVTAAEVEVDVLRAGGDPATSGDWILDVQSLTAAGLGALLELPSIQGVRVRCKSGGNAGSMPVSIWWEW
jgi:hypothetical protein